MSDEIPVIDCHNHVGVELSAWLRGDFPYAQMLPQLVAEGGAAGVTHWVAFPMVTNLSLDTAALREGRVAPGGLEPVPYAFENRRLLTELHEQFPQYQGRVFPFAMFDPLREPAAQAAALRALRRDFPIFGLKTQTTMLRAPVKNLLVGGRVFLELAEEWGVAVLVHSSVFPGDPWAQAADILDVAERTPGVRFCVAHSCRFDRPCLDRLTVLPNVWFDCSAHGIHCRLAQRESPHVAPPGRRFDSDYADPARVLSDLAAAYPDRLLWGSDSPYYSFASGGLSLFSTYAQEADFLRALSPEARRRVAFANTQDCFRLPLGEPE